MPTAQELSSPGLKLQRPTAGAICVPDAWMQAPRFVCGVFLWKRGLVVRANAYPVPSAGTAVGSDEAVAVATLAVWAVAAHDGGSPFHADPQRGGGSPFHADPQRGGGSLLHADFHLISPSRTGLQQAVETQSSQSIPGIADLQLRDVVLTNEKPHLIVRSGKGGKRRTVPLWLDRGTLNDLRAWKDFRISQGAGQNDPFLCHQRRGSTGRPLAVRSLQDRWDTIVHKVLEEERARQIACHCGRHSFASHLLDQGFSLVELRDWLGHGSISTTSIYLHVCPDRGSGVLDTFSF